MSFNKKYDFLNDMIYKTFGRRIPGNPDSPTNPSSTGWGPERTSRAGETPRQFAVFVPIWVYKSWTMTHGRLKGFPFRLKSLSFLEAGDEKAWPSLGIELVLRCTKVFLVFRVRAVLDHQARTPERVLDRNCY